MGKANLGAVLAAGALLGGAVAGCSSNTATVAPPPVTRNVEPTATPTTGVVFVAAVTSPTPVTRRKTGPKPAATHVSLPAGPYLLLKPTSGPPVSRTIALRGGNLPKVTQVQVTWTAGKRLSPVTLTTWTGPHGVFTSTFVIPATPPGDYRLNVLVDGGVVASATYHVRSLATMSATAEPTPRGDQVTIVGSRFVSRTRLLLVAYPLLKPKQHIVLGTPSSSAGGAFRFMTTTTKLAPGQYILRAYSMSALAAQMAETYLQVAA